MRILDKNRHLYSKLLFGAIVFLTLCTLLLLPFSGKVTVAQDPEIIGWHTFGKQAGECEMKGDPTVPHGSENVGNVKSTSSLGYGAWSAKIDSKKYLGNRIKLSGYVKTEELDSFASLFMDVLGQGDIILSSDAMKNRPISDTTNWNKYEIVLDVDKDSTSIKYGCLVFGKGQAWIDGLKIEIANQEIATTNTLGTWPEGSFKDYLVGGDPAAPHGSEKRGYIKSIVNEPKDFYAYGTYINPSEFINKRVKMSAYVKTQDVEDSVGLIMRVDGPSKPGEMNTLGFDNMRNRPIKGTTEWKNHEIVLDVPENSIGIYYGIILSGKGQAWIDGLKFDVVGNDVPVTGEYDFQNTL